MIHKVATGRRRRNSCKGGELERDRETKSTPLLLPPNAYFHMREIQIQMQIQINTTFSLTKCPLPYICNMHKKTKIKIAIILDVRKLCYIYIESWDEMDTIFRRPSSFTQRLLHNATLAYKNQNDRKLKKSTKTAFVTIYLMIFCGRIIGALSSDWLLPLPPIRQQHNTTTNNLNTTSKHTN